MGEALVRAQAQKVVTLIGQCTQLVLGQVGQRAASYSIEAMKMRGYDISKHRSRQVALD